VISIAELEQFLPKGISGPEWVGPALLLFVIAAGWNSVRAPSPFRDLRPARLYAIASLCTIVFGVWIGASLQPLLGTLLLAAGCALAVWSVLVSFGITWRNHLRPGVTPALLTIIALAAAIFWPRTVASVVILMLWWAAGVRRRARRAVDRQIENILTRVLVLTHTESAEYYVAEWFARFEPRASNLELLSLATGARDRIRMFPRSRRLSIATDSLEVLAKLAGTCLDLRLHTDETVGRTTSWVRVQTGDLLNRTAHGSGIPRFLRFLSALMLANPPSREETWADRAMGGGATAIPPDPEGYVVNIVAELPPIPSAQDLWAVREQVLRECEKSGPDWLSRLSDWAEQWREQTSAEGRDRRIEVVAEVLWAIYERDIGPRPSHYELFDQLRLQVPELLDGLSVRDARLDERSGLLLLRVNGMPKSFDQLTSPSHGSRTTSHIVLQSRDGRCWVLKRLEVATENEVLIVFRPETE
jgi:hypothetical protein